jgi:type II secretory ATPase GspE/PulE/Tfp pilus assembly ATPase PilB-like protein
LCKHCKKSTAATADELALVEIISANYPDGITIPKPLMLCRAVGCELCGNTGYSGRVGIFEAIVIDDAVEEVVIRDPREHVILEAAASQKIPTMAEDGIMKVINGTTSLDELERVVDLSEAKRAIRDNQQNTTEHPDDALFASHIVT